MMRAWFQNTKENWASLGIGLRGIDAGSNSDLITLDLRWSWDIHFPGSKAQIL